MKILFLGEIGLGQTSRMRMRALERLGHELLGVHTFVQWRQARWASRQIQRRLQFGSIIREINRSVLASARAFRPNLIWAEKQEFLHIDTIEELRKLGARLVHFTPDPYFTLNWKRTRLMDQAIRAFDVLLYCKPYERKYYETLGKPLVYMPLGYCDEVHRPLPSSDQRWHCMVGFLGGWEPRRERLLHAVAATRIGLKIWGGYWDFLSDGKWSLRRHLILRQLAGGDRFQFHRDELITEVYQGNEVYADDYARALTGSNIGLGFLRTVVPDQHTTRSFEIPACGSMLLADRTDEHQEFFEEGKDAEFFSSAEELLEKLKFYTENETARLRISRGGYARCEKSQYAYVYRMKAAVDGVRNLAGLC